MHANIRIHAIIFGAKLFNAEWNPSSILVCDNGDACLIPLTKEFSVSVSTSLS